MLPVAMPDPTRKPTPSRAAGRIAPYKRGAVLTSEPDYTADELDLLRAVEDWKKRTRRQFPTVTEILALVVGLGYAKAVARE
jgi:hypothetical protein